MTADEIDERVEQWHSDKTLTMSLREHLGMTRREYTRWVLRGLDHGTNPTSRNWREGHYLGHVRGKAVRRYIPLFDTPLSSLARGHLRGREARQQARRSGVPLVVTRMADQQGAQ